jgi:UDP-2,3-diacylglucosamine hydrolase
VRSWVLHGNRDFLLDASFEKQTGARVVPGGLLVERPGGESLLLLHGDELCLNDLEYQRSKKLLRSRRIRLLSRILPYRYVKRIAGGLRTRSQDAIGVRPMGEMRPSIRAFAELAQLDCSTLIYGHVHRAARSPWPEDPRGRSYHVLPAFTARRPGFVRQKGAGPLQLLEGGRELDWPEDSELGA